MNLYTYNCGQHDHRDIPHWVGDKWCDGRPSSQKN